MTRAVFMGTPEAAVPILAALRRVAEVCLVVTRPDRARGRSGRLVPPPIKVAAQESDLEIAQPASGDALLEAVTRVEPDVVVVAAYGRLIKPALLALPPHGFVNVHYSLLPRWRGASPVVRAILAGDDRTGVSLMLMDEGLDTGPVIASEAVPIDAVDTTASLTAKLAAVGASLLKSELPRFLGGESVPEPQIDVEATAAAKVTTVEAHVDPIRHSAEAVDRAVRAFTPKPGAWTMVDGARLKIWAVATLEPGEIKGVDPGRAEVVEGKVVLGTRTGPIELVSVQPAGRPAMRATDWMNGRRGRPADLS